MTDFPPPGPAGEPWPPPSPPPYAGRGVEPAQPAPPPQPPPGPPVGGRPGVVALRPLTLGDLFGGATLTMRHNPAATLGTAALVTLAFMLVPIVVTVALGAAGTFGDVGLLEQSEDPSAAIGINAASVVSGIFSALAGIVVTGLMMRVVEQAVVGRRISGLEALRRTRGRLLRLIGLSLLSGLLIALCLAIPALVGVAVGLAASSTPLAVVLGILGGLVGVAMTAFVYVRLLLLAAPNLVLEGRGVFASMSRAAELSRGQFWRLLGISVLAVLAAGVVGQLVAVPFVVVGLILAFLLPSGWGAVLFLLTTYLASILTGAITNPFTGGVAALQYYDQRFRKEGYDIELLRQTYGGPGGHPQ